MLWNKTKLLLSVLVLFLTVTSSASAYTYCEAVCTDKGTYQAKIWGENNNEDTAFKILQENCRTWLGGFSYPPARKGQVYLTNQVTQNEHTKSWDIDKEITKQNKSLVCRKR